MCGRYAITLPPEAVREWFRTYGEVPNWPVHYNAAPTTALPVVRQNVEGQRVLSLMQWGLVPYFSKDGKLSYSTINARAEGVRAASTYRGPFEKRRCLVPASGYFEWSRPEERSTAALLHAR
jgi:putative SOS response-associated peptidase YedK